MNSIDLIIPTMWRCEKFTEALYSYYEHDSIQNIFLIDNDYNKRPKNLKTHKKLTIVNYGKNIYVNPAWNEGYYRSNADVLGVINDDITVDGEIFTFMRDLDFSEVDIIGVHLKGTIDNFNITHHQDRKEELIRLNVNKSQPIGGQSYAYGVCMFIKRSSYRVIPSLYQVWYGDDYLIQRCENIYALKTSKIRGEISRTIVSPDIRASVEKRIHQDSLNVYRHNHFFNGKNWDIIKKSIRR
jgi:hypothetical protein